MQKIKKIAVLGASGNMGSLSGGIFAQAGIQCVYFARSVEKAQAGIDAAVGQARSDVLRDVITPRSYDDLEKEIPDCDWIFEGLAEDMNIKNEFFSRIEKVRKKGSIVSTVSSGLSIRAMAEGRDPDFQAHFMGTHFYNPPGKLLANELIFHPNVSKDVRKFVTKFCDEVLGRANIVTHDVPAFAGNRIGFQFLNEAALYAEKYGVEKIDYLLGPYTGRAMPPLATIDLVGLDVHKAIVENVYANVKDERIETYKMPAYMHTMIERGMLGRKARGAGGFFNRDENKNKTVLDISTLSFKPAEKYKLDWVEKVKGLIYDGLYSAAVDIIKNEPGEEAAIVRHFILGYVSYSYARIGEVTPLEDGIHGIDRVMSSGFSWMPASGWVQLLGGGEETAKLMVKEKLPVPAELTKNEKKNKCQIPDISRFLIGR
ncbi:MAG: 3-hydroxyacyl-CoA dehydrogenase family protein [Leptospiraceae bacterium]|nr:3-hydroxyacyl-CoA dehydrogenase family protein [Leptospiraceae bacterium]MCB1199868.1 3-hydroxyacyl-CoA dehydrogenase family protein [Leptospiraceae bacterium]